MLTIKLTFGNYRVKTKTNEQILNITELELNINVF